MFIEQPFFFIDYYITMLYNDYQRGYFMNKIRKNLTISKKQDVLLHQLAEKLKISQSQIVGMLIETLARENEKNDGAVRFVSYRLDVKNGRLTAVKKDLF